MAAVLLIFVVCLLSLSSADGQDIKQDNTNTNGLRGPESFVTDGTRELSLTCGSDTSVTDVYVWVFPGSDNFNCSSGKGENVCTFRPRLQDDQKNVTCKIVSTITLGDDTLHTYKVNLKYPPQSKPNITIQPNKTEPLKQGDIITCTVSGGKPRVTSVTFYCRNPDHTDQQDDVSDDGRSVSSSINVNTSKATEQDMECTCKANWDPEPGLYQDQTIMNFQLESRPRVFGTSYNSSHPLILAATGRTFFLVACPTPDTTKSYFVRPNEDKVRVRDNTFKTEFTENSSMEHLVNCRVTPQNVREENLGLYELSISNRLGDVSVFVNVTSPVIQHSEKKAIRPGVIVGGVIGGIALLGIIVTIVILVIRRKRRAGYKEHDDKTSDIPTMTPTATPHVVQPNTNNKINACPSSTYIESEPGYATPSEVRKTDCRSTDSKSGTIINSEQDDYNHLNENTAPPVDSSTYSRVGDDSRRAQQEGSVDSATPTSIASAPDKSTGKIIGPNGDVYSTVPQQQKGGNPPPTDDE